MIGRCVAILLATSSALKAYELVIVDHVVVGGFAISREAAISIVIVEMVLAWALLTGYAEKLTLLAVLVLFSVFSAVTFQLTISGAASCGCFGVIVVPPLITLLMDVTILVAVGFKIRRIHLRDELSHRRRSKQHRGARLVTALFVVVAVGLMLFRPSTRFNPVLVQEGSQPIMAKFDEDSTWIFITYRKECPKCKSEIAQWIEMAQLDRESNGRQWSLLDVGQEGGGAPPSLDLPVYRLTMPTIETPRILVVIRGKVIENHKSFDDFFLESALINQQMP